MVGVTVGDHHQVYVVDAVATEGGVEHRGIRPAVDQDHRVGRLADEDGVALAHVEEHHRRVRRRWDRQAARQYHGAGHGADQRPPPPGDGEATRHQPEGGNPAQPDLGPARRRRGHGEHTAGRHESEVEHGTDPGDRPDPPEHGGRRHQRRGEHVGHRAEQWHRVEVRQDDRQHGELGTDRDGERRPQPPRPSPGNELDGGQHPGGGRHRQLEADVDGEVARDEQQTGDRQPECPPRLDGYPDDATTEHDSRHRRRPDHRRLPTGGHHECPQRHHTEERPQARIEPERPDDQPPRRQEEGNVAPRHGDEVGQPGPAQLFHSLVGEPVGLAHEEPGDQRGGVRVALFEAVEDDPTQQVARPEERPGCGCDELDRVDVYRRAVGGPPVVARPIGDRALDGDQVTGGDGVADGVLAFRFVERRQQRDLTRGARSGRRAPA